jgi:hypothetical protein
LGKQLVKSKRGKQVRVGESGQSELELGRKGGHSPDGPTGNIGLEKVMCFRTGGRKSDREPFHRTWKKKTESPFQRHGQTKAKHIPQMWYSLSGYALS